LGNIAVPSTGTELVSGGNRLFLECVRFDRRGEHGRIAQIRARIISRIRRVLP
jgi:hypothetical protein